MSPDFLFGIVRGDVVYDIETYPNVFTLKAKHVVTGQRWTFEISQRRDDTNLLRLWLGVLKAQSCHMVGFNNIGFDYPVLHYIYNYEFVTVADIYAKAMSIIKGPFNMRFSHMVWESEWIVEQIDLYKIHHFDNVARATSLKVLEFNMRMQSIEDLPFPVGEDLTSDQIDTLLEYNDHDVDATFDFYTHSLKQIKFRELLSKKYNKNFMNHNDTKIGKDYFIMELEKRNPGCCYQKADGKKKVMQTPRASIKVSDIILPIVEFNHPEFNRILNWFNQQVITETKGAFKHISKNPIDVGCKNNVDDKGVSCTINGFKFDFGTGGIHGSIDSCVVESDDEYMIIDVDVASYYPNLAIVNNLYPAHLGETFCDIYKDLYEERKKHKKDTPENAMLKLALNGVYGDSNNKYSPFYDSQYTMSITINGQLLLCMLAEMLMIRDDIQILQINTDGVTIRCRRNNETLINYVCAGWENLTGLTLESVEYKRLFIRDCNNYIAEYTDGSLKRKGAYANVTVNEDPKHFDIGWHQNHSALIVPKAAEGALVQGEDVRTFIENHDDVMDFMLRAKVPRDSYLEHGGDRVANIVRYYISTDGDILEKVMPPKGPAGEFKRANKLTDDYFDEVMSDIGEGVWDERIHTKNRSVYEERKSGINTGWTVRLCNNIQGHTFSDINCEWYIQEVGKLIDCMKDN